MEHFDRTKRPNGWFIVPRGWSCSRVGSSIKDNDVANYGYSCPHSIGLVGCSVFADVSKQDSYGPPVIRQMPHSTV